MADLYSDTYHDLYGTAPSPASPGQIADFDGVNGPLLDVELGLGATAGEPHPGSLTLGVGPGLGTGTLGATTWTSIISDVISITITRGRQGELEQTPPGSMALVVDNTSGAYDSENPAGPWYGQIDVGLPVRFTATWDGTVHRRYYGYLDDDGILDLGYDPTVTFPCVDALERLGRAFVGQITAAYDGDYSGARIGRILDAAAHPTTLRALDTGRSQLVATTFGGYALPLIEEVNATELGLVFVAGDGKVTFYNRHHGATASRSTQVQANLTDTGTPGSLEVEMTSLEMRSPRDLLFNEAAVTAGQDGAAEQTSSDFDSQQTYGPRRFPNQIGTLLRSDGEALGLCQWIVGGYKTPRRRISSVRVDGSTQGLWSVLLPLTLLDRIAVSRTYIPDVTVTAELLIQGVAEEINLRDKTWVWTFQTSNPVSTTPLILGQVALGTGRLAY